jgi:hypothetical protein
MSAALTNSEKLKIAKQAKAFNEEATGLARINNLLVASLHDEFGLMLTTKSNITSTSPEYGFALFWYMKLNHVEKFSRAQYSTIYKQMMECEEASHPQKIVLWLDRHFQAFKTAGEPITAAEKTRIFLNMIENRLGREMMTHIRRMPREYKLDADPDYDVFKRVIMMQMEEEIDFPTPMKRVQVLAEEVNSPEERIRILEEKLAKLTKPDARPKAKSKTNEDDESWKRGLRRLQFETDATEIWEPGAACAFHFYKPGTEVSKETKGYHTNAECRMINKKEMQRKPKRNE